MRACRRRNVVGAEDLGQAKVQSSATTFCLGNIDMFQAG